MADAFKVLAQAQLAGSVATLYTVPGATKTIVRSIFLQETSGAGGPYTAFLYVGGTGAGNQVKRLTLDNDESAEWTGTLALETGQTVRGYASAANKITITISGDEVT